MNALGFALDYAARGMPVFPLRGKRPLTEHGLKDASADTAKIRAWWEKMPDANIGIPTGRISGLWVLDVDPRHNGDESLATLEAEYGSLPMTLESRTGNGGRHLFFALSNGQAIRNSAGKLAPGLDVRGEGGYVVVPPSVHPETNSKYIWANEAKPGQAPAWLVGRLAVVPDSRESSGGSQIPEGQRNAKLTSLAGAMRRRGCSVEAIEETLLAENSRRCEPRLSENEVRSIARSVSRYGPRPTKAAETQTSQVEAVMRCFNDITPQVIRWLWPGRIPLGKLTLLIGDPGLGKSLVTIDVASRVTRGASFSDSARCESGGAIFLSAEDDAADTIRPRLDAAAADVSRVHILEAVRVTLTDGSLTEKSFNLETDVAALEGALQQHPEVRLIVIDPISAYLGGVESHSNAEVRGLLAPLAAIAARYGVAVLCVTHLRKSAGAAIHRAIASIAFAAAARAVWAVAPDPENPARRLMLPVKQNLAPDGGGLAFHVEALEGVPRTNWEIGTVSLDANDVLGGLENCEGRGALAKAKSWLKEQLANGPLPAAKIKTEAGDAGIAWATVRRAKDALGIVHRKGGFDAGWQWALEDAHPIDTQLSTFEQAAENRKLNGNPADEGAQVLKMGTFGQKRFEEGEL